MGKVVALGVTVALGVVGWLFFLKETPVKTPASIERRFGEGVRLSALPTQPMTITETARFDDLFGAELTVDGDRGAIVAGTGLMLFDLADPAAPKVIGKMTLPDRFKRDGVRYLGADGHVHYLSAGNAGVHAIVADREGNARILGEVGPWKGALRLTCAEHRCVTDKGIWTIEQGATATPVLLFAKHTSRFVLFDRWVYWLDGGMLAFVSLDVANGADFDEVAREIKLPLDNADYCGVPRAIRPDRLAVECANTLSLLTGAPGQAPRLAQVVKEPLPGHLLRVDEGYVTGMTIPGLEGMTLRYRLETDGKATPLYALDFVSDMGEFPWTVTGDRLMTVKEKTRGVILRLDGDELPTVVGEITVAEGGRLIPVGMSVWRIEPEKVTVFAVKES